MPMTNAERSKQLRFRYGLTEADYQRMLAEQYGVCQACGCLPKAGRRLCVDHSHETGDARGLLCTGCNLHLGRYGEDNPNLKPYLKQYLLIHERAAA